ncbi:MAG: class I SAM-dependent methyltransferase [Lachnospiraceae bacterium]|nr:class I SAM-dependent methyltransferase [Lachnospiraceae bacterium]
MNSIWDKKAENYDKHTKKMFLEANNKIVHQTKKNCKNYDTILDVGCGTGMIIKELASSVCKVKAIDTSTEMISMARKNDIPNIDWEVNDLYHIDTRNETFSIITAFNILLYINDVNGFLKYVYDILPEGGHFISVTDCFGEKPGIDKYMIRLGMRLGKFPEMKTFKMEELKKIISSIGFHVDYEENMCDRTHNYFIVARKDSK